MKITKWIFALIITTAIILGYTGYQNDRKCESILSMQETAYRTLEKQINIITNQSNKAEIEKIEQLVRENILLKQENDDLKTQIREFGWWKGK